MEIIKTWNSLTTEKQIDWLQACALKATMREVTSGDTERFLQFHGMDDLTSEAWLKATERLTTDYLNDLNTKRAAEGKAEITLNSIVYRSALDAVRTAYRSDKRHEHDSLTIIDAEGIDTGEAISAAKRHADETEAIALGRMILAEFADKRDHVDRLIIETIRDGFAMCHAAAAAGISSPAITKRLRKLRDALRKELAA